jgi:hypothetical protein
MAARGTCNWDDGEQPLAEQQAVSAVRRLTVRIILLSLVLALVLTALLYWIP